MGPIVKCCGVADSNDQSEESVSQVGGLRGRRVITNPNGGWSQFVRGISRFFQAVLRFFSLSPRPNQGMANGIPAVDTQNKTTENPNPSNTSSFFKDCVPKGTVLYKAIDEHNDYQIFFKSNDHHIIPCSPGLESFSENARTVNKKIEELSDNFELNAFQHYNSLRGSDQVLEFILKVGEIQKCVTLRVFKEDDEIKIRSVSIAG